MTIVTTEGKTSSYWICKLPTPVIEPSFEVSSPQLPPILIGILEVVVKGGQIVPNSKPPHQLPVFSRRREESNIWESMTSLKL